MATIRLIPSTYYLSSTQYLTVADAANMYTNTDSDTYATITNTQIGTTSYYLYIRGFNFSDVPSDATVTSFSVKFKVRESGVTTSTSYRPYLCNNTTTITGTASMPGTTASVITFTDVTATWDTIKGYGTNGANFGIRINCRRANRNNTGYLYVYGAEIEVTYSLPNPRTITSTLSGNGTISPSGATTLYDDDEYELTITPTNKSDTVTVKNNGTDVTDDLETHYVSGSGTTTSSSFTAGSFTTSLSASGANFYTGSNTTGNYFNYAVGHTAASPGSTSTSYNTYVKDGGSNTATGSAIYAFDFSSIPVKAEINSITVQCYGACENTTYDSTHKAEVSLYSGNTLKSTPQNFTSTSNSTITISSPGEWSRKDLDDATLHFTVAYYGGRLFGITWSVNYTYGGTVSYYTYTYVVSGNATIAVTIGGSAQQDKLYFKNNNTWVAATKVYKKVNGSWVEQADLTNVFSSGTNYVKG